MRAFCDTCEIALSEADLKHALMLWVERVTLCSRGDYVIEKATLHPGNKYVVRMVVKPPAVVKKAAQVAKSERDEIIEQTTADENA